MMDAMPIAWMLHPLRGYGRYTADDNLKRAKRWMQWLLRTFPQVDTCADWILWCELLNDANPAERARGLKYDNEMVKRLDLIWLVGGTQSSGMVSDLNIAQTYEKAVIDMLALGDEPPADLKVTARVRAAVGERIDHWWMPPNGITIDGRPPFHVQVR